MTSPYFRTARIALGLTAAEIGERVGRSLRTVRLYDSGKLDPAPEALSATSTLISDMAQKLEPYFNTRSGSHRTFTLYDYQSEEHFHDEAGDEYEGWTLGQYRAFLGHLIVLLEAKGLSYQLVQKEQKEI